MIVERSAGGVRAAAVRGGSTRAPLTRRRIVPRIRVNRQSLLGFAHTSMLAQLMFAMGLISVAAIIYLAQASEVSVHEFAIADLRRDQMTLMMQRADLTATSTQLQSLTRVTAIATGQLHMTKPVLSTTIWIRPVVPVVTAPPPPVQTVAAAKRRSEPLAWMTHALTFLLSQL